MTSDEYREAIAKLGWSQVKAGDFLGANERTSRRWAKEGAPASVGIALAAMCLLKDMGLDPSKIPGIVAQRKPAGE
jgi:hypothetical protein